MHFYKMKFGNIDINEHIMYSTVVLCLHFLCATIATNSELKRNLDKTTSLNAVDTRTYDHLRTGYRFTALR